IPTIKLNNGREMPVEGYGCWKINYDRVWSLGSWLFNDDNRAGQVVLQAIRAGYRYIDSAYFYNVEKGVGHALRYAFRTGIVKREDMFIATKIWNNFHRRDRVVEGIRRSLRDMGLDYVDLAIIHWPMGFEDGDDVFPMYWNLSNVPREWSRNGFVETWQGMTDALDMGLAKSIGVSNFNIKQLKVLMDSSKIKPVVNQVECNPYYNQNKMLEFCQQNNIVMTAYSPLRQGYDLLDDPNLRRIARRHNKTAAQVALRWNIQRGVAVIPKSERRRRMNENINVFDFELRDDEMKAIDLLRQMPKLLTFGTTRSHPDYPFHDSY
ncbi:unnamed protein product, partial [Oppiella nova]